MKRCKNLSDYSTFVHLIRTYMKKGFSLNNAAEQTINECIHNHILEDLLLKHRGEVTNVVLSTFYKDVHEREQKEFYENKGIKKGAQILLISQIKRNMARGKSFSEIAEFLDSTIQEVESIAGFINEYPTTDATELYNLIIKNTKE